MTDRAAVRASCVVFLLLGHAIAGAEYLVRHGTVPVPDFWTKQFFALLAVSAAISVVFPFIKRKGGAAFLLAAQACAIMLACYPEGTSHTIRTVLTAMAVFEAGFFLPVPAAAAAAVLMIALSTFGIDWIIVWNNRPPPVSSEGRPLLVFFPLFSGMIALWLQRLLLASDRQLEMIGRLDNAVTQLTGANVDFQEYAAAAERESAVNERKRIARDIHDTVGYHLMNVIMMMEAGADIVPSESEKLKEIITQTRDQAKDGLMETRNALRALRSAEQEKLDGLRAIQKLIDVFERVTGVQVQREYGNLPPRLPGGVVSILYRIVQEGLTNAFKHGRATRIVLYFWIDDEQILRVKMRDNGQGFSGDLKAGIGLAGMKERLESIQGTLSVGNAVDGFELNVEIPLSENKLKQESLHG